MCEFCYFFLFSEFKSTLKEQNTKIGKVKNGDLCVSLMNKRLEKYSVYLREAKGRAAKGISEKT